ncbi:hypothetical protein [Saccharothrix obliqua]|uniref:hypothetical protein n=1 Tax=Saccharothrix obliqua TaxID=2861747 RepID=UPI001C605DD0|nr:hypothetical protein [Saccharothrix obliqua]MBW4717317.1 hypothetical protein [Saccharothrix obliqua]
MTFMSLVAVSVAFCWPWWVSLVLRPLWLLATLLVLSGLFVTPVFINAFLLVDSSIDERLRHEANTWVGASTDVANGIIAIAIGALVTGQKWDTALALLSGCAIAGLLIVLALSRTATMRRTVSPSESSINTAA